MTENEKATALVDGRDEELDSERDDAEASGAAYTAESDEDEAAEGEGEGDSETDAEAEAYAEAEAEAEAEDGDDAGAGAFDEAGEADESVGVGRIEPVGEAYEAEEGGAEPTDLTGYLPAYREPSGTSSAPAVPAVPAAPAVPGSAATASASAGGRSARMQEIQLGFVDDPRRAALDAQELLIDALRSLTEESVRERDVLRGSVGETNPDTERMRLAVRRARELIDSVSGTN